MEYFLIQLIIRSGDREGGEGDGVGGDEGEGGGRGGVEDGCSCNFSKHVPARSVSNMIKRILFSPEYQWRCPDQTEQGENNFQENRVIWSNESS